MTRDYSDFLSTSIKPDPLRTAASEILKLGWQPYFAQQTDADEINETPPVRVCEVHRSGLRVRGFECDSVLPPRADATIGDWFLLDQSDPGASKLLRRSSLLKRRAPGSDRQVQLIAANVDTAFITTSCNADFNVARLERYIAMVLDAEITPVVVLTKTDLVDTAQDFARQAEALSSGLAVVPLDARGGEALSALAPWTKIGQTVAFLGSSGVGKSTLTNALVGQLSAETREIREDDARGRHTTTHRQLHMVPDGCVVLDTPGMRELQLTDVSAGLETVFADLYERAEHCKFNDCQHDSEPGCAIRAGIESGEIDEPRLARWKKLAAEDEFNTLSLFERRSKDRAFGKKVRAIQKGKAK